MKKLFLASAVAALSLSSAHAAPSIYGKAFLTLDANKTDKSSTDVSHTIHAKDVPPTTNPVVEGNPRSVSSSVSGLNSIGSRVGFKGSEVIDDDMDFQYQLEYGVNAVNDKETQFTARDSFIGLAHKQMGSIKVGRLTSVDVDYANKATGGVLGGAGILSSYDGDRYNNAVVYEAPKLSDIQLSALYAKDDIDKRKNFVVAAAYEPDNQPFKIGASYANAQKAWRVSGDYTPVPAITVGALYQNINYSPNSENTMAVSATYNDIDKLKPYVQVDYATNIKGNSLDNNKRVLLGTTYEFNNNITGHLYGAAVNTSELVTDDERKDGVGSVRVHRDKVSGFGVGGGVEYKF